MYGICHRLLTFHFCSIWTLGFFSCIFFVVEIFRWNAVCGFYCSSPVCHCCNLVPELWFVLAAHLSLSLLLSKTDLWLLSNSLCSFSYIPRTIQHCSNVPLSLSHIVGFVSSCFMKKLICNLVLIGLAVLCYTLVK